MNTSLTTLLFSAIIVVCNGYLVKAPKEGRQIKFRAIDCSNPTRFRSTAFSDVCKNEPMAPAERVNAIVLQRLYERTQKAVRCERRITVLHSSVVHSLTQNWLRRLMSNYLNHLENKNVRGPYIQALTSPTKARLLLWNSTASTSTRR